LFSSILVFAANDFTPSKFGYEAGRVRKRKKYPLRNSADYMTLESHTEIQLPIAVASNIEGRKYIVVLKRGRC
jgi:hypothetical protein